MLGRGELGVDVCNCVCFMGELAGDESIVGRNGEVVLTVVVGCNSCCAED
jgi:hypothetical protein